MDRRTVAMVLFFASHLFCLRVEAYHGHLAKRDTNAQCGGEITGGSGTISSPGFPDNYPNKLNCIWTVEAPLGSYIEMLFGPLMIEKGTGNNCNYDYLQITVDGKDHLGPYCNNHKPTEQQRLVGTHFRIKFVSDDGVGKSGFLLVYSTTQSPYRQAEEIKENKNGCSSPNVMAGTGIIKTPKYPQKYPNNISCSWTIEAETDKLAYVELKSFDVEKSDGCQYDHVTITVGGNHTMGPYCNAILPPTSRVNGTKFHITFYSDEAVDGRGFLLVYGSYYISRQGDVTTSGPAGTVNHTAVPTEWMHTEKETTDVPHTAEVLPYPNTPPAGKTPPGKEVTPTAEATSTEVAVSPGASENMSMDSVETEEMTVSSADTTDGKVNDSTKDGVNVKHVGPGGTNVGAVVAGVTVPLLIIIGAAVVIVRLFMKGQSSSGQGLRHHTRQKVDGDKRNQPAPDGQDSNPSDDPSTENDQNPKQEETEGEKEEEPTEPEVQAANGEAAPAENQEGATAEETVSIEQPSTPEEVATTGNQPKATCKETAPVVNPANVTCEVDPVVNPENVTNQEATSVGNPANTTNEGAASVVNPPNATYEEAVPVVDSPKATCGDAASVVNPPNATYEEAVPATGTSAEAAPVVPPADPTYEDPVPVISQITVAAADVTEAATPNTEAPIPAAEPEDAPDQPSDEPGDAPGPSSAETAPSDDSPSDEQPGTS